MNSIRIPWKISTIAVTLLSVAGLAAFVYSLLQLTAIQAQMDQTMEAIRTSVGTTSQLVGQTSKALQPLTKTTQALLAIEQNQKDTTSHLMSMNNHLRQTGNIESSIIDRLDSLNASTSQINAQLSGMQNVNAQLLSQSRQSVAQANQETAGVADLNGMTSTSIQEMHQLNGKLSVLRLLP